MVKNSGRFFLKVICPPMANVGDKQVYAITFLTGALNMQPALFLSCFVLPKTQAQAVGLEITNMSHVPDFVFPFFGPNCSIGSQFLFQSVC